MKLLVLLKEIIELNDYFLSFCQQQDWDEWLQCYVFCYNITLHVDTNMSTHELLFGKIVSLPNIITDTKSQTLYNIDDYALELKKLLQKAHQIAQKLLNIAKNKRKEIYDMNTNPTDIKPGHRVWLKVGTRKKNVSPYEGSYLVVETNNVNAKIKIGDKIEEVHKNRLKKGN